jgi:hypothetical protein
VNAARGESNTSRVRQFDALRVEVLLAGHDGGVDAVGELPSRFRRAVVVFAGGDVAPAAVEVDVRATFLLRLAAFAREAGEIAAHAAVAVVAHWVAGVVMTGGQFRFAVIKRHGFQPRINQPLGQFPVPRILAGTAPPIGGDHFAVGTEGAAIPRDLLNPGLAGGDVRDGAQFPLRLRHRRRATVEA